MSPQTEGAEPTITKTEAKRRQMIDAALTVFVTNGYVGTSTDQLAAAAAVSKQTLYKTFGDKEGVFAALIHHAADGIRDPFAPLLDTMREAATAEEALRLLATQFTRSILNPHVQQLRRLVIAEATRFPELGLLFWERGFVRVSESVGRCLQILDERQLLAIPDLRIAVEHFAGMLLWIPSNRIMFAGAALPVTEDELDRIITAGSNAFLRAYQRD
ncbi:TetR/AcrR family transcriptional regulator [Herbiconiux sp. CPCC 205763]|uniref:TetR/AcrR family transcriptional regulator n=1 Tax=Herbiconiux aconitum TaxID=2970913 RepID=A0ABT2GT96_9MICO|nr:TetR/AcrR family transcriptional regulator [Herbiconiux aconitum]MCS5719373.1 TetR/AcrR family transcriptional regulator [Herbiconiux aconitum]